MTALPRIAPATAPVPPRDGGFPRGFTWGAAIASYQVEGAVHEEGRGPSIWDTFSHTPGKTRNGDTGDVAADFFHRYREDVALMNDLGIGALRFSVAWPRVFPTGTGVANPKGLDFYDRLVDALLFAGIQPFCTLYHWDLPQALEEKGGWQSRDTAQAFADYAGHVAAHLSDRVTHFITMNEIRSFTELGYGVGVHAPGLTLSRARLAQVEHHAVLGHGLAVRAIRANARREVRVGIADNVTVAVPVIEDPEQIGAAERAIRELNAMFLTAILEGAYTDAYLRALGPAAPKHTPDELRIISTPLDFVGLNIYAPTWVRAADTLPGYEVISNPPSYPHMLSPWLAVGPEALYWGPRLVTRVWGVGDLYITENGASAADVVMPDGQVWDTDRTMYLRNCLAQLQRATSEGVPVSGYFLWSLLDNFEWADGYETRFGITHVDFATQRRTPKLSARFYREMIRRNGTA